MIFRFAGAKVLILCEQTKNANLFLSIVVNKGIWQCQKFAFLFVFFTSRTCFCTFPSGLLPSSMRAGFSSPPRSLLPPVPACCWCRCMSWWTDASDEPGKSALGDWPCRHQCIKQTIVGTFHEVTVDADVNFFGGQFTL